MKEYTDILSGTLPELERWIIRFRVFHSALFLFYIEDIKSNIIETAKINLKHEKNDKIKIQGIRDAVNFLVTKMIFSQKDADEFLSLVDYRNTIAHDIYQIFLDVAADKKSRLQALLRLRGEKNFDDFSLDRIVALKEKFYDRNNSGSLIFSVGLNGVYFRAVEKFLLSEIARSKSHISWLKERRALSMEAINKELYNIYQNFKGDSHPLSFSNKYKNNKLTKSGISICYELFSQGYSDAAIAHAMSIKIASIRKRRWMWQNYRASREGAPTTKFTIS